MSIKCLVVGIVCNIENSLKKDVDCIRSALRRFEDKIGWFLVESDSEDSSRDKLNEFALGTKNFYFQSLGNLRENIPARTERMAYARNEYLRQLNENPLFKEVEYVVVCDFNNLNSELNYAAVDSSFHRTDWDACFANPKGPYYDIWALRHELWSPNDCWKQLEFFRKNKVFPEKALYAAVHSKMITIPSGNEWIKVKSAFGGFGIYKAKVLRNVHYRGIELDGSPVCEHVPLNTAIDASGGKLFINPDLINCGYVDHTIHTLTHKKVFRIMSYPRKSIKEYLKKRKNLI